jgi:hypothetical protein
VPPSSTRIGESLAASYASRVKRKIKGLNRPAGHGAYLEDGQLPGVITQISRDKCSLL